jgi:predicted acylesterase/phospholipase RssA
MDEKGNSHALVLSGGGALGSYEIGVMKALFSGASPTTGYKPLDADIFTGTSVGAYNASYMVSEPGVDSLATLRVLERLWVERVAENAAACGNGVYRFRFDPLDFFSPSCLAAHPLKPFMDILQDVRVLSVDWFDRLGDFLRAGRDRRSVTDLLDLSSFISTDPLYSLVTETINLAKIRTHPTKQLRFAATNWETGDIKVFRNQDLDDKIGHKAICASTAIPGVFPPIEIMETKYVDGGVLLNTPLQPAIAAGGDVIHVIYLDPELRDVPIEPYPSTLDTLSRMLAISAAHSVNHDVEHAKELNRGLTLVEHPERAAELSAAEAAHFVQTIELVRKYLGSGRRYRPVTIYRYRPNRDMGGITALLDFRREKIEELIELGYEDTVKHDFAASEDVVPLGSGLPGEQVVIAAEKAAAAAESAVTAAQAAEAAEATV